MRFLYKTISPESGFTLIELVASMVIFGLMFALAGMGIVMAARGYVLTKESAHMAQKAQLAMGRMDRELMEITDVAAAATTQPNPYLIYDRIDGRRAIAKDGTSLKMFFNLDPTQTSLPAYSAGDILTDAVSQFTLTYHKSDATAWIAGADDIKDLSSVDIELAMSRPDSNVGEKTFRLTVRPRNTRN